MKICWVLLLVLKIQFLSAKIEWGGYGHRYLLKQDKASGALSGHILLSEELNKQTKKARVSELRSLCFLS